MLVKEAERTTSRLLVVTPLIIAGALFVYKSSSAIKVIRSTWASGTIAGRPGVVAFGGNITAVGAFERTINYFSVIWPALVFGVLIAAAVRAFVSPQWFAGFIGDRSIKTQLRAGLAGAPLMLCSCCVAPVFTSVVESSARLGPALALMLASPSLNPAALVLTFLLFEPRVAALRLLLAFGSVLLIGSAVERLAGEDWRLYPSEVPDRNNSFVRSLANISIRTIPGIIAGVFASMLIVQWLPPQTFASPAAKAAAVLLTATVAVPLALPTFLEIPLSLGLLAAGFPAGAAVALLFAGPAINLPSLFSVARTSGWKVAGMVAALIWAGAVAGGMLAG
jgi:uncharacterized protein